MIEITPIRSFLVLAQNLSFVRAAKILNITQPTLSHQIQKLEKDLGVTLFERNPHLVRLTEQGQLFQSKAFKLWETYEAATQSFAKTNRTKAGRIRLGLIPTIGPYLLPRLLKQMRQSAPGIEWQLHEFTTSLLLENLKAGLFDLGILALPIVDPALAAAVIGSEDFWVAAPKTHRLAQKQKIHLSDLKKENLLMLQEGHCLRTQALQFCAEHRTDLHITFEGSSLVSVMNLAATGFGITLVPQMATQTPHAGLKFVPFKTPAPNRQIALVWRMSYGLKPHEKFFLEALRKSFWPLAK